MERNSLKKRIGQGNTAEVFEYKAGKVCKLFFEGYPSEYIELEYNNAKALFDKKIKIPIPFKIVSMKNRKGIVYEKINGETLDSLLRKDKENLDELINCFAQIHREILRYEGTNLLSYKTFLAAMVNRKTTENRTLIDKIHNLSDGKYMLHGDFHPGNILVQSDGTFVILDFMNVCQGPVLYDIARTHFLLKLMNYEMAERYLDKMDVTKADIEKYLDVIEMCREYED